MQALSSTENIPDNWTLTVMATKNFSIFTRISVILFLSENPFDDQLFFKLKISDTDTCNSLLPIPIQVNNEHSTT